MSEGRIKYSRKRSPLQEHKLHHQQNRQRQQLHSNSQYQQQQQQQCGARVGGRVAFLLWGIFFSSLSLQRRQSYAFVIHHHTLQYQSSIEFYRKCRVDRSSGCRIMTQQQQQRTNSLRHRFLLHTKAKQKDDDDDNDGVDFGMAAQSHNIDTAGEEMHHPTRTHSHSNIERNLIIKRTRQLQQENEQLKQTIQKLQKDNRQLQKQQQLHQPNAALKTTGSTTKTHPIIALERFERDTKLGKTSNHTHKDDIEYGSSSSNTIGDDDNEMWCDTPNANDGTCPLEPNVAFTEALRDRAVWLVSLLIMQSISGIILYKNEIVLSNHPSIIYFLTMLVGAGGNAGNQASVRVIRGIAIGALQPNNRTAQLQFLLREFKMAFALSIIVAIVGFLRTILFHSIAPLSEAIAITVALYMIVFTSICFGAILPFILQRLRIDPAHSSTSIQVIMDILGVYLTVAVTRLLLDSPFGKVIVSKFT